MKRFIVLLLVCSVAGFVPDSVFAASKQASIEGAWSYTDGQVEHTAVFVDGYFSHSRFDLQNKQFLATRGGTYQLKDGVLSVVWQYDTEKAAAEVAPEDWVGQTGRFSVNLSAAGSMQSDISGTGAQWTQTDQNDGALSGVWRMTSRKQGDNISTTPLRDRRTLKILTGTRFQWVAINIKTGQFSGTGGGTYTYVNGKYTENIEFFSRDNSRVGASLEFDGQMQNGEWHHSGLSSAGNPIYEIWGKLEE